MADQVIKKVFDLRLLRRIFSFTAPYRKTLYLAMVLAIILAIISPMRPYLIKVSVDKYVNNNLLMGLIWISVFQLGILLVESALRFWFTYRANWLGQTVVNDLRNDV